MGDDDTFVPSQTQELDDDTETALLRDTGWLSDNRSTFLLVVFCVLAGSTGYAFTAEFINTILCSFQVLNEYLFSTTLAPTSVSGDIGESMKQLFLTCQKQSIFGPLRVITGLIGGLASVYQMVLWLSGPSGEKMRNRLS